MTPWDGHAWSPPDGPAITAFAPRPNGTRLTAALPVINALDNEMGFPGAEPADRDLKVEAISLSKD